MLGRLLTAVLGHVDLIRLAPLPQRSLGRLRLECVPLLKTVRVPAWQPLFNKPEREIVPKVKLSLVRDLDVLPNVRVSAAAHRRAGRRQLQADVGLHWHIRNATPL